MSVEDFVWQMKSTILQESRVKSQESRVQLQDSFVGLISAQRFDHRTRYIGFLAL